MRKDTISLAVALLLGITNADMSYNPNLYNWRKDVAYKQVNVNLPDISGKTQSLYLP